MREVDRPGRRPARRQDGVGCVRLIDRGQPEEGAAGHRPEVKAPRSCQTRYVSIDVAALLLGVVGDVFDDEVAVDDEGVSPSMPHAYVVRLRANDREAVLVASDEWSEIQVMDPGVRCTVFHYGGDETEKATVLRELARVLRAFLNGEGHIEYQRRLLPWPRRVPAYTVTVNDLTWHLGRHSWSTPI